MSYTNPKPKYIYKACEDMRIVNMSDFFPHNCGETKLKLRDFTAGGVNNHPNFLASYYAEKPYWVQVLDEDDFILQAEFSNLSDAQHFFEAFLDNPRKAMEVML